MKTAKKRFEPMLLLVIGIPAATVIAGVYTLMLALADPDAGAAPSSAPTTIKGVPLR